MTKILAHLQIAAVAFLLILAVSIYTIPALVLYSIGSVLFWIQDKMRGLERWNKRNLEDPVFAWSKRNMKAARMRLGTYKEPEKPSGNRRTVSLGIDLQGRDAGRSLTTDN